MNQLSILEDLQLQMCKVKLTVVQYIYIKYNLSGLYLNELLKLSNEKNDHTEQDIVERKKSIIEGFLQYLKDSELIG